MMLLQRLSPLLLHFIFLVQATPTPTLSGSAPSISTIEPGNQQEFDDVCAGYKACGEKGLGYWNILQHTLQDDKSRDRTDGIDKFKQYYSAQFDETKAADFDIYDDLEKHGFDPDYLDSWVTVDKGTKSSFHDLFKPYKNSFNTRDGLIIAESNFRSDDQAKQLEWSELMYQTWQAASAYADHQAAYGVVPHPKGGPISGLKSVVQIICVNAKTQEVVKTLYKAMGYEIGVDVEWKRWTEAEQPCFFYALLGTDNVKGTVYLLNDHANEIGRKEITEIWTRWEVLAPDIWINVGPSPWS